MNASSLVFVVVAVASAALLSEARPEGHFGIQYNQQTGRHECPLVLMLPFTDVRAGPPEWAKHSITTLPEEGSGDGHGTEGDSHSDHPHRGLAGADTSSAKIPLQDTEYYGFGSWPNVETLQKASFDWLASALLAMNHFNARDSTVVPILADDEFHQCTVTFPTDSTLVLDSGYDKSVAFDKMFTLVSAQKPMCAVVGPETPEAVQAVSLITEDIGIPQSLSYKSLYSGQNPGAIVEEDDDDFDENDEDVIAGGSASSQRSTGGGSTDFGPAPVQRLM